MAAHSSGQVSVVLRRRGDPAPRFLSVPLEEQGDVAALQALVSERTGIPPEHMHVLFSGRRLSPQHKVAELLLGPQT